MLIGPKEASIRDLRNNRRARHHELMIEDGCPASLLRTGESPAIANFKPRDPGVTLAPPLAVQKAAAAAASVSETKIETPTQEETDTMATKKAKVPARKAATGKTNGATKPHAAQAKQTGKNGSTHASTAPSGGTKTEIVAALLKRPEGCTTVDVLGATGWPSVSMPAMAKAAGLTLQKEKDGKVTRYRAA